MIIQSRYIIILAARVILLCVNFTGGGRGDEMSGGEGRARIYYDFTYFRSIFVRDLISLGLFWLRPGPKCEQKEFLG